MTVFMYVHVCMYVCMSACISIYCMQVNIDVYRLKCMNVCALINISMHAETLQIWKYRKLGILEILNFEIMYVVGRHI